MEAILEYKIIKKVDRLGRIVLPLEMRKCYGIELNGSIEIIPVEKGVLIRKSECESGISAENREM